MGGSGNATPSVKKRAKLLLANIQKLKDLRSQLPRDFKTFRQEAGLTQEKAAWYAGVSVRTWVSWEHGTIPESFDPLGRLCQYIIAQHKLPLQE